VTTRGHGIVTAACDDDSRRVRLALLDGFELSNEAGPLALPLPAQRLLAFLALRDRPVRRSYVACTLWIDSSEARAFGSLRSALWRLRRDGHALVDAVNGGLRLGADVSVDLSEATAAAHRVLDADGDIDDADRDLVTVGGELLPDWYDDWVLIERERFRQLRVHALERLCERLTSARKFTEAVEAGLAAVDGEPLRESAHRALIHAHLAEGNASDALRQYQIFRTLLRDRLGLEPSGQMDALVRTVVQSPVRLVTDR
jgi:DNA-binding SARP family transcriptional activator